MRISWKWLKELVEFEKTPAETASLLTMSGIEVESIIHREHQIEGIFAGKLLDVFAHPSTEKLKVCKVDVGNNMVLNVVTGATGLRIDQLVPLARVGAVLADGRKIYKTGFKGIDSEGMLCSAEELGLDPDKLSSEEKDGIYPLPGEICPGEDIALLLNLNDVVFELGLTPNRADCWGMINVAREVASLTGGKLKLPTVTDHGAGAGDSVKASVQIDDPQLCRRYVAKIISDVHVEDSPLWLKARLMNIGLRPINNIVDITNLVMYETGQPLHAFDLDSLAGQKIIVRKAINGEKIITLDGQNRNLNNDMLVIADALKPVAIAGVMGGLESEVTLKTKNILLESAFFHGPAIRRTSAELGLRSEASQRFEKGIDLENTALVAERAAELILEIEAGKPAHGYIDSYPNPEEKVSVKLRKNRINKILGTKLGTEVVQKVLEALNFEFEANGDSWLVQIPSYRRDIRLEVDLIEEIARINGYDKIPTTLPRGKMTQGKKNWAQTVRAKASQIMSMQGLYQVLTFSFINPRHLDQLLIPEKHKWRDVISVQNPLSEEQGIMRTNVIAGLLEVVRKNYNKRNKNIAIYEIGKVYFNDTFLQKSALPTEKYILAAAATGHSEKTWAYPILEYDFYYLKGVLENLFKNLGINEEDCKFVHDKSIPFLHPGRAAKIFIHQQECGWIGEVHPLVLENYGLEQKTVLCSFEIEKATDFATENKLYREIPRFPALIRDMAVIVPDEISAAEILELILSKGQPLLKQARIFDLYKGKQIERGQRSLAFSLTWQADDRTMTDEEVNQLHENILEALAVKFKAQIRS